MLACPGVGHTQRGYERVTEELARRLEGRVKTTLVAGGGDILPTSQRVRLPCIPREHPLAMRVAGNAEGAYTLEQRTFAVGLYGLLRATRADVVHLHDPAVMNVLWHLRRRLGGRYRIVFTNGGLLSPEHLFRADMLQVTSPVDEHNVLHAGHQRARVRMIPYGVDSPPRLARAPAADAPLRVVGVGTLDVIKGVEIAIRAVESLDGATLVFAGARGPGTPALEAEARERLGGRARLMTVAQHEVPGLLADANVFVLPTQGEGFGMAVLEAMAAGLPCVVADVPVLRWLVAGAGILVGTRDPHAWTVALRQAAMRWDDLAAAARARAAQLNWETLLPEYEAMYRAA